MTRNARFSWLLALCAAPCLAQNTQVSALDPPTIAPNIETTLNICGAGFTTSSSVRFTSHTYSTTVAASFIGPDRLSVRIYLPPGSYVVTVSSANGTAQWLSLDVAPQVLQSDISMNLAPGSPFAPGYNSGSLYNSTAFQLADLNGDGIPDLVSGNPFQNGVDVAMGRGDGSFKSLGPLTPPASLVDAYVTAVPGVVVADFNGDFNMDIAAVAAVQSPTDGSYTWAVSVYAGNGKGSFKQGIDAIGGGGQPGLMVTGDFNGDSKPDLAVAIGSSIHLLYGDGNGYFTAGPVVNACATLGLRAGDFNNDGKTDLVAVCKGSQAGTGSAAVFINHGNGNFVSTSLGSAVAAAVADFNRDGSPDIVTVENSQATVYLGSGTGSFSPSTVSLPANPGRWAAISAGDLDGDGLPDLIVGDPNNLGVVFQQTNGTFGNARSFGTTVNTAVLEVADLNQDGHADIVTSDLAGLAYDAIIQSGVLSYNPPSINFPAIGVGQMVAQALTFQNVGSAPIVVPPNMITGKNPGAFSVTDSSGCVGSTLAPGADCTVIVYYHATLMGAESASYSPVSLSGTGLEAIPTPNPAALSFGSYYPAVAAPQSFTVKNSGNTPMTIDFIYVTAGANTGSKDFTETDNCSTPNIPAGSSCTVTVTFTPSSQKVESATLNLQYTGAGLNGTQTVKLSGQQSYAPWGFPTISPAVVTFPATAVHTLSQAIVTVNNYGQQPWQFQNYTLSGADPGDFIFASPYTCAQTLQAFQSCQIVLYFLPQATGARSASMSIYGVSANFLYQGSVGLTGTGQ